MHDISFPCAKCHVNMNVRCNKLIYGEHARVRPPAWIINRTEKASHRTTSFVLYKVVSGLEYHLIRLSNNRMFPAKFEDKQIFVSSNRESYACTAAKEISSKTGSIWLVMRVKVKTLVNVQTRYDAGFPEYLISSNDMDRFNRNIVGQIEIAHVFRGEK